MATIQSLPLTSLPFSGSSSINPAELPILESTSSPLPPAIIRVSFAAGAVRTYDTLVFGDVVTGFVHRPNSSPEAATGDELSSGEVTATVAEVALPEVAVDASYNKFIAQVTTSAIDSANNLVGFQGEFTFDERVVTFESEPVQRAGITGGNWNVSGNVLPGTGPIRTLRVSAYSNDFTPLSGAGTLFELRMPGWARESKGAPVRIALGGATEPVHLHRRQSQHTDAWLRSARQPHHSGIRK